jgi:hypothetical protein
MYSTNYFHKTFLNILGGIKTSGGTETLVPGQLGFASAKTWQLIGTGAADVADFPEVYLVQGSLHKNDKIGKFHGGYAESIKSRKINGKYITHFTKFTPRVEKAHVVQLGYNGSADCACPSFEKDKTYWLRVEVKGSAVLRTYNRNLYRTIGVYTGCASSDCTDVACAETADPKKVFEKFAEQILQEPEIRHFLKEVKVVTAGTTSITGTTINVYRATRSCDLSNIEDLAKVKAVFPTATVFSATSSTVTYEVRKTGGAPSNDSGLGITWALADVVYKAQKKICITLPLKSNGASNLSDVTSFYSGNALVSGIVRYDEGTTTTTTTTSTTSTSTTTQAGTSYVGCTETIQATLLSSNEVDVICEGVDVAVFNFPQSYEGRTWEDCPCETVSENVDQCVGLRLVAKKSTEVTDSFKNQSFSQFDHVETEPITIIVSFVNQHGETCDYKDVKVTEIQLPVIREGLGEFVVRDLIRSAMLDQNFFTEDTRIREALEYPFLDAVDRNANYVYYEIAHNVPTGIGPSGNIGQDKFLYKIYVKEGVSAASFETWMNTYLTSAGTGVSLVTL